MPPTRYLECLDEAIISALDRGVRVTAGNALQLRPRLLRRDRDYDSYCFSCTETKLNG